MCKDVFVKELKLIGSDERDELLQGARGGALFGELCKASPHGARSP